MDDHGKPRASGVSFPFWTLFEFGGIDMDRDWTGSMVDLFKHCISGCGSINIVRWYAWKGTEHYEDRS